MKKETASYKDLTEELLEITRLVSEFNIHNNKFNISIDISKKKHTGYLTLYRIMELASELSGETPENINNSTCGNPVLIRQICHYTAMKRSGKTPEEIGYYFGGRDGSTVYHSRLSIQNRIDTDKEFRSKWGDLLKVEP